MHRGGIGERGEDVVGTEFLELTDIIGDGVEERGRADEVEFVAEAGGRVLTKEQLLGEGVLVQSVVMVTELWPCYLLTPRGRDHTVRGGLKRGEGRSKVLCLDILFL